ncbi:MAG: tyrosine--tRNA ligase [Candidatus Omnitrophica bacterium]|nr:tyrosine--tRNA ligase [Candidatus Omnitrophota bacterium]
MSPTLEIQKQLQVFEEGTVDLISKPELKSKLETASKEKKPLRIKYGADPSSPDLHLGHTVPLRRLRAFQELGHTIVFIIGDFTALIGDPTQRIQTRPMLSEDEVKQNAATYQEQVFRILDREKTEVRYNSEWLGKMTSAEFLQLTAQYTVARLLERDDFQKRYKKGSPIALVEFLYPLLQGYDSVVLHSDIEIGGTDQKFNLLMGRELQRVWNQPPQVVMTFPIIEGLDGVQKMSKSLNNHIALEDPPNEMFGKIMSLPDTLMESYYRYVSALPSEKIKEVMKAMKAGKIHPRDAKADLAEQIVGLYYSETEAKSARREFDQIFRDRGLPQEIPSVTLRVKQCDIVTLLKDSGLVESKGEARRLIEQGGVKVEQKKVTDPMTPIDLAQPVIVQCGKRKFAKVQYHAG